MVWLHTERWLAPDSDIDRSWFSLDWFGMALLRAAPLFILCFGCGLGMLNWQAGGSALRGRLARRALVIWLCYKALFALELISFHASSFAIWRALTYQRLSWWVEVLDFYALALLLLPLLLPAWLRLPRLLAWATLPLPWLIGFCLRATPLPPSLQPLQALLAGLPRRHAFAFFYWLPTVLVGVELGRCWKVTPQNLGRRCLGWAAVCLPVAWLCEGGWSLEDLRLQLIFNGWKHPPHAAYVAFMTSGACFWLWLCTRLYGTGRSPKFEHGLLACLGRHPLTVYCGHFVVLFALNFVLGCFMKTPYELALGAAFGLPLACLLLTRVLERWQGELD